MPALLSSLMSLGLTTARRLTAAKRLLPTMLMTLETAMDRRRMTKLMNRFPPM